MKTEIVFSPSVLFIENIYKTTFPKRLVKSDTQW